MISSSFMCGVVEGFYGRPWTPDQRVELFDLISSLGLNAYIYAPKDDLKHRAYWRELYSVEEAEHLTALIQSAKENNVTFVYALSPGLDITFSNSKEVTCLKRKLEQVKQFGVDAFALLFDDIDTDMCVADKEVFQSFAHAQVSITNEVFQHLGQPKFLFCPTEYCATRADPNVKTSEYLTTIGKKLLPDINFMWTGPKVVSKVISLESIKELSDVIKRKPVIWDNIHANDYDQKRIFLGPYKGRSTTLYPYLNGIFTNPNCEFEVNFIAFHTLAAWAKCAETPVDRKKGGLPCSPAISADIKLEQEGDIEDSIESSTDHGSYDPDKALVEAVSDWMEEVMDSKTASSKFRRRRTGVPLNVLGTNPPPLPGINTCMSTTTPTVTEEGDTQQQPTLPMAEEIRKNKEAFDNLADLVGVNSNTDPETFRPPPEMSAVNSLVVPKTDDISEPMECNGNIQSVAPTTPTTSCSMVQTCTSTVMTVSKVSEMAMQIDESLSKDSQSPKTTELELSPASGADSSSESAQDTEMQIDTTTDPEPDKAGPSDIISSETSTSEKDADKVVVEDKENPAFIPAVKTNEQLTKEDVMLLIELFYLPYEHGLRAVAMLEEVHWLKMNAYSVCEAKKTGNPSNKAMEWTDRAAKFLSYAKEVHGMMTRMLNIPNRSLLYYLYPYVWDMEGVLSLLASFIKWLVNGMVTQMFCNYLETQYSWCSKNHKEAFMSGDLEPWVFRGGLTGEFQRMLPLESANDLFCKQPHRILSIVYTIRPYLPKDEEGVYKVCLQTCDDGSDGTETFPDSPNLIGDKLVGHFLTLSPEYCFVLEESDQIVGYVLATLDAKAYYKKMEVAWIEEMKRKYSKPSKTSNLTPAEELIQGFHSFNPYKSDKLFERFPSLLRMDVLPDVEDKGVAKNMLACVLSALKANGSKGAFVEVCTGDKNHLEAYTKLGFGEVPESETSQDEGVHIVARAI